MKSVHIAVPPQTTKTPLAFRVLAAEPEALLLAGLRAGVPPTIVSPSHAVEVRLRVSDLVPLADSSLANSSPGNSAPDVLRI